MSHKLKYLQPEQYASWLKKVDDPDWTNHRYRDAKDSAMISAIRELRDARADNKALLDDRAELLEALMIIDLNAKNGSSISAIARAAIRKSKASREHSEPQ